MSTRARPEGCCPLRALRPLPVRKRAEFVNVFKALADPTRLEIVRLISGQDGPTCACDIVDHFDLSQPTISHHLKILRDAGLLSMSRMGIWSFYALDEDGVAALSDGCALLDPPARRRAS